MLFGVKLKYHPHLFPNNWRSYQKQTVGLCYHSVYVITYSSSQSDHNKRRLLYYNDRKTLLNANEKVFKKICKIFWNWPKIEIINISKRVTLGQLCWKQKHVNYNYSTEKKRLKTQKTEDWRQKRDQKSKQTRKLHLCRTDRSEQEKERKISSDWKIINKDKNKNNFWLVQTWTRQTTLPSLSRHRKKNKEDNNFNQSTLKMWPRKHFPSQKKFIVHSPKVETF